MGRDDNKEKARTESGSFVKMNNTPANYPCGKGGQQTNCLPQPESVWHSVADEIDPALIDMKPVMLGDFPDEWRAMLYDLIDLWRIKYARNALRYRYYDGKNVLKDFGIAIPPTLRNVETVVGWPQRPLTQWPFACASMVSRLKMPTRKRCSMTFEALAFCGKVQTGRAINAYS